MLQRTAILALVLLSTGACSEDKRTPEQQIEARLDDGVKALEKKDIQAAGDLLHEGYKDSLGRDRGKMKAIAFFMLRRGPVRLALSDRRVEVDESGTKATVHAKVTAVQAAGAPETVRDLVPRGRAVEVEIALVKEGDDWLVTSIDGDGVSSRDDL